jgi:hypothetical protein
LIDLIKQLFFMLNTYVITQENTNYILEIGKSDTLPSIMSQEKLRGMPPGFIDPSNNATLVIDYKPSKGTQLTTYAVISPGNILSSPFNIKYFK